jgi:hypothetical protein
MYNYIETCRSHFKNGRSKKEKNGGDEPNWGTLYTYMELPHEAFLCNSSIPIKPLKIKLTKQSVWFCFWWSILEMLSRHL